MNKAGTYLKNIREEKGYSLSEVSKATKISPTVLRALEEGSFENIDQVYLKSFVKMYCRFLEVKWEGFLKEYPLNPLEPKHTAKQAVIQKEKKEQIKSAAKKTFSFSEILVKHKKIILTILSAVALILFLMVTIRGCRAILKNLPKKQHSNLAQSKKKTPSPAATAPKPRQSLKPPQPKEEVTAKPLKSSPETTSTGSSAAQPKESKPKEITVAISAHEDSFLKIKVDGQALYQGMLRKGKAESWRAKEKIELSVGNAGGIVLEANGKMFSPLGRRGQSIKNIVITIEGLKIL